MRQGRTGLRYMAVGLGSMAAGALLLLGAIPGNAGATPQQTTPSSSIVADPNATCASLGFEFGFTIETPQGDEVPDEGPYTDPVSGLVVTLSNVTEGDADTPATFDFTTSFPISGVYVKSGPGGILYTFDPPTMSGTGLASPNPGISHISFCWNEEDTTTTTTTSTSTSTTSTSTTTSTVPDTTSTTLGGSTTTAGGVSPTTVAGQLPRTGSTTGPMVGIGAALLAGGAGLVGFARRFRHS